MRKFVRKIANSETAVARVRRVALHTSAFGFAADFVHAVVGKAMVLAAYWEHVREPVVTYSAVAATVVVYMDSARERIRKAREKEVANEERGE